MGDRLVVAAHRTYFARWYTKEVRMKVDCVALPAGLRNDVRLRCGYPIEA